MRQVYFFILPFFTFVFFQKNAHAQDTIKIQTFTWDSNTRSEVFQFPDDPNQSFRKIWMRYNMRCHDAAVGNGAVGCREWDYSCNTFVTDPSGVDSTRQTAPTHVISNFSGTVFEYTTQPVFEYTQYLQHDATATIANEVSGTIGAGAIPMPLSAQQPVGRSQFLFTASELTAAGLSAGAIHALEFQQANSGELGFLRLRAKVTALEELNSQNPDLEGFTEVYFKNTQFEMSGPARLDFYQPFEWDGSSNILLDLSYTGGSGNAAILAEDSGFNRSLFNGTEDFSLHFAGAEQVDVPAEKFATVSDQITVSLWAKGTPEIMPANSTVFEGKDATNQRQVNVHLPWGNGQVYWDCGNDGGGYDRINKQANEADYEGQWNHWAFTKNAATGEMKIYLNGQLWHSGTGKTKPIDVAEFAIGAAVTGGSKYFGNADEFRVWNVALDEATIAAWMRRPLDASHPNYANLVAYFQMDEGTGFSVNDVLGGDAATVALPNWQRQRGRDLFKNFSSGGLRPNITFVQGDAAVQDVTVAVLDSVAMPQHSVTSYGLDGTDLVVTGTEYFYQAGQAYVLDESGQVIDSVAVAPEGTIEIGELTHFTKADAKYEILSLVTPYGNGLDLGNAGKTFVFDVTDYAPILRGEKRLSIEMGGEWQEELDIEFLFITGTPPREVLNIQNIWPFRRGWYDQIQNDRFFEPRQVQLLPEGQHYKLRSAITGHGQNGEFVPRTHYLNLDGDGQEFTYEVWKECADNPIYPQGGTWIFDRAGWCPGAATDVHEFDITGLVIPGGTVEVDYGVNGSFMAEANYLVSNQLVTYGAYAYILDASLERIARPNTTDVEFERINPACSAPIVWVKNTGSGTIFSLTIEYFVQGNSDVQTFEWGGTLAPEQLAAITLPVEEVSFWMTPEDNKIFEANIAAVNGTADEFAGNNAATQAFQLTDVYTNDKEYILTVQTNLHGYENSYRLKNAAGEVVMERPEMEASTLYEDALDLPPGCYTLEFFDAGNDGLYFWFFPEYGTGSLRINRKVNNFFVPVKSFLSDHGAGVQYDFVIEEVTGAKEEEQAFRRFSVYPNPAAETVTIELQGFENEEITAELTDLQGRTIFTKNFGKVAAPSWQQPLDLTDVAAGFYLMKIRSEGKVWVRKIVKTEH